MTKDEDDTMREEYTPADLGPGERGKFLAAYREGSNLVLLAPDVAAAFPSEEAVNGALRALMSVAERCVPKATP